MKLLQARRLELRVIRKNGLTEELIHAWEKLFLNFENLKLHTGEKNYKELRYQVQNLIKKK